MEDKIRDKLLLDVPERYTSYSDSSSSINHLQLNSDVIGFQSYCKKRRIKNPMSQVHARLFHHSFCSTPVLLDGKTYLKYHVSAFVGQV